MPMVCDEQYCSNVGNQLSIIKFNYIHFKNTQQNESCPVSVGCIPKLNDRALIDRCRYFKSDRPRERPTQIGDAIPDFEFLVLRDVVPLPLTGVQEFRCAKITFFKSMTNQLNTVISNKLDFVKRAKKSSENVPNLKKNVKDFCSPQIFAVSRRTN